MFLLEVQPILFRAITYVQNMVNPLRVSHVVYVVGSKNSTGTDAAARLLGTAGVHSYALNYNTVTYAGLLTGAPGTVFKFVFSILVRWLGVAGSKTVPTS